MRPLFFLLILIFSPFNIFADDEISKLSGTLDSETGELFWDLNTAFTLEYISPCKLEEKDYSDKFLFIQNYLYDFVELDYFDDREKYVECNEAGLKIINRLKQDGSFSFDEEKRLLFEINGNEIYVNNRFKSNFEPIFAAIRSKEPAIIKIYNSPTYHESILGAYRRLGEPESDYEARRESLKPELVLEGVIDTNIISKSDEITRQFLQEKAELHNVNLDKKLNFIIGYNALIIIVVSLFMSLFCYVIYRYFKKRTGAFKEGIKNTLFKYFQTKHKDNKIIRSEKFKSYSVADELLKWSKLKEDGVVSEDEYQKARSRLLDRG